MRRPPFKPKVFAGALVPEALIRDESKKRKPRCDKAAATGYDLQVAAADGSLDQIAPARRGRLADLDANFACSIIGTCLRTTELRKLVAKFKDLVWSTSTDLEVHQAAVELAAEGGAGAKALTKLLDDRYASVIHRFRGVKSAESLGEMWSEAMKAGEIAGAYWSVMAHPCCSSQLRRRAFGDVHMLSHLVGAANRVDIRQLVALERENGELKEKSERQQSRLQEMNVKHQETVRQLTGKILDLTSRVHCESEDVARIVSELSVLRNAIRDKEQEASLHANRRKEAERRLTAQGEQARRLQVKFDEAMTLIHELHAELGAMERQIEGAANTQNGSLGLAAVAGRHLLYVGGRPATNAVIRNLCERAGIDLTLHDGGIEDRKGLLDAAVPGAELVLFPVDCVDHDSVGKLKRLCQRHGVSFVPLRTAGVGSFVSALTTYSVNPGAPGGPPASHFCLRHG